MNGGSKENKRGALTNKLRYIFGVEIKKSLKFRKFRQSFQTYSQSCRSVDRTDVKSPNICILTIALVSKH